MTPRLVSSTSPEAPPAAERPPLGGRPRLVRFGEAAGPAPRPPAAPREAEVLHPAPVAGERLVRHAAAPPRRRDPASLLPFQRRPGQPAAAPAPGAAHWALSGPALVTFGQLRRRPLGRGAARQVAGTGIGGAIALALLLQRAHPPLAEPGALAGWLGMVFALALGIGLVTGVLARRGWGAVALPLAALTLGLHPLAALALAGESHLLATLGGTLLLGLMLDRLEALGDPRSLMGVGLALALLLPLAPQAAPGALLAVALLPAASRDMRGPAATLGLFLTALLPAAAVLLAMAIVAPGAPAALLQRIGEGTDWLAFTPWPPLHPAAPALTLGALVLLTPPLALVLRALAGRASERARPVTALYALAIGPVTLLAAGLTGHAAPLPLAAAAAWAGLLAWTMSSRLGPGTRGGWVLLAGTGAALGWLLLWLAGTPPG
jgi:hypothetical protein